MAFIDFRSLFVLVADVYSQRRSVLTSGGTMGDGCFCGCFWHFSADMLHSVGQVPVMAGDSRSLCQAFYLGACIFRVYATHNCLRSMMVHLLRQVFHTWMWKVVKAIANTNANAFEKVVRTIF
jgi:hypothetical protein